jgi:hypothetical protein
MSAEKAAAKRKITEAEMVAGRAAKCTGCGCRVSLALLKRRHPQALSCCPERDMRALT